MTRWYQPEDYGVFAVINNMATFLASLFLLSLPNALPIIHTWHARARLLRTLIALTMVAFVVTSMGTMLFLVASHEKGGVSGSEWAFTLLPFLVLVISLHRISQSWANAEGAFNSMAVARIVHPMVAKPFAIAASMLSSANPVYIIFFEGVAYFFQAMTMVRGRAQKLKQISFRLNRKSAPLGLATIRRYKDYALFLNFVNLLSLGFITLQTLILTGAYSPTETGHFALATSMTSLPIQLISMAAAPVIYHRLIVCGREDPHTLRTKLFKLLLAFALLGALPYLSIFYYGPDLFSLAFGQEWGASGEIASILALPVFLQFLYTPISSIFRITSSIKLQFRVDLIFILTTIVIFYLSAQELSFTHAMTIFAVVVSIHQLVGISFCLYVARNSKTQKPDTASLK
jgi:O-antigen/teichoic acid export membrane protein